MTTIAEEEDPVLTPDFSNLLNFSPSGLTDDAANVTGSYSLVAQPIDAVLDEYENDVKYAFLPKVERPVSDVLSCSDPNLGLRGDWDLPDRLFR